MGAASRKKFNESSNNKKNLFDQIGKMPNLQLLPTGKIKSR
jgi:hypothetical protein